MSAKDPYAGESEAQCRTRHAAMATDRTAKKVVETAELKGEREAREAEEISAAHEHDVQLAARGGERRVARMRSSIASDPVVVAMSRKLGELTAERAEEKAQATVKAALEAHKLFPVQREWALAYCRSDPAGFATFIKNEPVKIAEPGLAAPSAESRNRRRRRYERDRPESVLRCSSSIP